ncbi:hypothetical protein AB0J40_08655 [Amycolatopsis sp. NPDC049691]|uniref:hypothetical protein n=1 Tax=Amycolatopsis sp. NPDC049691 TaxID=3155155 RepID=UPI00343FD6A4
MRSKPAGADNGIAVPVPARRRRGRQRGEGASHGWGSLLPSVPDAGRAPRSPDPCPRSLTTPGGPGRPGGRSGSTTRRLVPRRSGHPGLGRRAEPALGYAGSGTVPMYRDARCPAAPPASSGWARACAARELAAAPAPAKVVETLERALA